MQSKTVHWIFTGLTALTGVLQSVQPFIPPAAGGAVLVGLAIINGVLHSLPAEVAQ